MTEFTKQEFFRLVDKLGETDPSTTAYHILLQSIECFDSIAPTIDGVVQLRDADAVEDKLKVIEMVKAVPPAVTPQDKIAEAVKTAPFETTDFPAPAVNEEIVPAAEEKKTYDAPTVRKALLDARARGVNVKEVLKSFGADGFQAVPADRYGDLMAALEVV